MLNYGASTNWAFARIGAMTGSNEESSLEAFGRAMRVRRWMDNVATDTELAGVFARLSKASQSIFGIGETSSSWTRRVADPPRRRTVAL